MIDLYLTLILLAAAAIAACIASRPQRVVDARGGGWPVVVKTEDGDIVVFRDGTVEWHEGTRMQALRVVPPGYWEEAI